MPPLPSLVAAGVGAGQVKPGHPREAAARLVSGAHARADAKALNLSEARQD
jgi:hypothetical protein